MINWKQYFSELTVGSVVVIRDDLIEETFYRDLMFNRRMKRYGGRTAVITSTDDSEVDELGVLYKLNIDGGVWCWNEEMFL